MKSRGPNWMARREKEIGCKLYEHEHDLIMRAVKQDKASGGKQAEWMRSALLDAARKQLAQAGAGVPVEMTVGDLKEEIKRELIADLRKNLFGTE